MHSKTVITFVAVAAAGLIAFLVFTNLRKGAPAASSPPADTGVQQSEQAGSPADASEPGFAESRLQLGEAKRLGDREIQVPLELTPGEETGSIRADVLVPEGPWKFEEAETPKGSHWKITAKPTSGNGAGSSEIELKILADSRAIRNGLIGYLTFSVAAAGVPAAIPLKLENVETSPPETDETAPSGELPPQPDQPAPAVGCFFFTH